MGATGLVTEMVTAAGISRRSVKSIRFLRFHPEEQPLGVQLFGAGSDDFARSAGLVSGLGFSFIDINAGCPVKKVLKSGSGSALLRDLPGLFRIIRATADSTDLPVLVKIRLGFTPLEPLPGDVCLQIAEAGASGITIHGRYRSDMFGGKVDPRGIERLSRHSPVPVVANGDVASGSDAEALLSLEGVTGVMVGRAALGNPWLFRELCGGPPRPFPGELREVIMEHLDMMIDQGREPGVYRAMRGHLLHYLKRFPGAASLRSRAIRVENRDDVLALADEAEERIAGER